MNELLNKLTKEILTYSGDEGDFDFTDEFEAKAARIDLSGCNYGDKLVILWKINEPELDDDGEVLDDGTFEDIGYLTTIPGVLDEDAPEFSAIIHVPHPQNPGGMGNVEGEWISVFDAINNPLIVSIKPQPPA